MSDAHLRMIHSFESILFKGLIKPFGKPVNRFANQFEWFVQFPAARAESSEVVLATESLKNIKSVERSGARPVPGGMPLPRPGAPLRILGLLNSIFTRALLWGRGRGRGRGRGGGGGFVGFPLRTDHVPVESP